MVLDEAIKAAYEGHFVSNSSFDSKQSMHVYDGHLFYEDGADLTACNFVKELKTYEWAKQNWFIKYPKERVDREKLRDMHNSRKFMLLGDDNYEDCIMNSK
jgi:hypothetical protein